MVEVQGRGALACLLTGSEPQVVPKNHFKGTILIVKDTQKLKA